MILIKFWCLPAEQSEKQLNQIHRAIVEVAVTFRSLGIKREKVVCLSLSGLVSYNLDQKIIIEVSGLRDSEASGLYRKPEQIKDEKQRLAKSIGRFVKNLYPEARVECFISTLDPEQGFWISD